MQCLQLDYESGRGKHKQTSSSRDVALRTIQSLELGYEPCPCERKQAWQALNGPYGPIQCLQLGERKLFKCVLGPPGPLA